MPFIYQMHETSCFEQQFVVCLWKILKREVTEGDIVDGWRLKKNWYWPESHNAVIQRLLWKARQRGAIPR